MNNDPPQRSRSQVITPQLITFAAMVAAISIPVSEEDRKKEIGIRPQNLNPIRGTSQTIGCGSTGCRKFERCICDCKKCRASCKMRPQHFTEMRTLPCCGIEIPWDPIWFAHLQKVTKGTITEESVLDGLRTKHQCPGPKSDV